MSQAAFDQFYLKKFAVRILPLNLMVLALAAEVVTLITWLTRDAAQPRRILIMAMGGGVLLALAILCNRFAWQGKVLATSSTVMLYGSIVATMGATSAYYDGRGGIAFMSYGMMMLFVGALFAPRYWLLIVGVAAILGPIIFISTIGEPRVPQQTRQLVTFSLVTFTATSLFYVLVKRVKWSYFRVLEDLQDRTHRDTLTGLLNRATWFERAGLRLAAAPGSSRRPWIIFTDVDYFKAVNDEHGHGVGDQVLKRVAEAVYAGFEDDALVARFGGEEFVVLISEGGEEEAVTAIERVRDRLERAIDLPMAVTMSFGVAECRVGESLDWAVERADRALIQAKRNGRNRTEYAVDNVAGHTDEQLIVGSL